MRAIPLYAIYSQAQLFIFNYFKLQTHRKRERERGKVFIFVYNDVRIGYKYTVL